MAAKKKILIIVENAPVPFDPRVWNEARALQRHEYDVTVLSPRRKGYAKTCEVIDGVRIYRHPLPKDGNTLLGYTYEYGCALFWEFLFAWWIYLRHGFDVIQSCNPPDDIFLVALPFKLLGVKYIFDHHDACPELYLSKYDKKGVFYKIQVWLEKMTYRVSDVVMATNESYRNLAMTRGKLAPEDVFVVRNGPNLDTLKAVTPKPDLKFGKPYLVGYVGNMSEQDGLDILLDVAAHVKHLGRRDVHFTCVGGGPGLAGLRKMNRDKNLEDIVTFTGRIPDGELLDILSTADVCVNPDKPCQMNDMSTMIKIMEYMALGKPIVQFESKEGRFSADEASLYSDPENQVSDFASKILWLLENPDERKRMGEFGRKRIEEELAWQYSVPSLLAAYRRAFAKRAKRTEADSDLDRFLADRKLGLGHSVNRVLSDYYRVPERELGPVWAAEPSGETGFFRFGPEVICFGQSASGVSSKVDNSDAYDALKSARRKDSEVYLPFDPAQIIENLRRERYVRRSRANQRRIVDHPLARKSYYYIRELLPVSIRKHLQKVYLSGWQKLRFPSWPVDFTVDKIHEELLRLSMEAGGVERVPFIWFWPEGASNCLIMTHDVETAAGRDFTPVLIDLDHFYGFNASFQVIPEKRYEVPDEYVRQIRSRGCEFNIHDLNHDGHLYQEREKFLQRAKQINKYITKFDTRGFRAGAMYRNLDWYGAYDFSYDMSVPNVAHLEPQRGGCCTVMPYFIGNILEIPLMTIQDYSLFHILGDYSIDLWKQQIEIILKGNGLISFVVHPDYVIEKRARAVYAELLQHLAKLRDERKLWSALPGEVNRWWRNRNQMKLIAAGDGWRIEGPDSDRARVAYATLDGDRLKYTVESQSRALVPPTEDGIHSN
ncbi:MAG: glycosyltransferase [Candidatus Acidiferrales bacterium]